MNRWTLLRLDGSVVVLNVSLVAALDAVRAELACDKFARFTMRYRGVSA